MEYILITLRLKDREDIDLKIPAFITGEELFKVLSIIIGSPLAQNSKIQAEPLGRILDNSQTLYAEGVGQGALLTILSTEKVNSYEYI
ncbi:MAG: hypothetical protein FWG61_04155 [Firmicutes bacterium]|nr:hypothetical protein [Bacillota bacterium]